VFPGGGEGCTVLMDVQPCGTTLLGDERGRQSVSLMRGGVRGGAGSGVVLGYVGGESIEVTKVFLRRGGG
jgi:hypothetical protein